MTHHATWMQTASGLVFDPAAPTVDMIAIEDIAHALSNLCRFAGHTRWHYSVGEHSERASRAVVEALHTPGKGGGPEITIVALARAALMHDAAEAYLVDLPSPVKRLVTGYKEIEARVEAVICAKFGVPIADLHHPLIKHVDLVMLATEKRDLFGPSPRPWGGLPEPLARTILPRSAFSAELAFRQRFDELFG